MWETRKNVHPGPPLVNWVTRIYNSLLRSLNGCGMAFGSCLGLDLITHLQSSLRFGGLVDMDADFFAGCLLYGVVLAVDFQHVSFDGLGRAAFPHGIGSVTY